jgi:hypothetical protein
MGGGYGWPLILIGMAVATVILSVYALWKKHKKDEYFIDFFLFCFKIRNEKMLEWWTTNKINKCLIIAINTLPMFN